MTPKPHSSADVNVVRVAIEDQVYGSVYRREVSEAFERLVEQLEAALRDRDAIGAALGEPCAECGHIEWRSDGYVDSLLEAAQHEANWWRDRASAEADKRRRLEKDRDSWAKVAREY